MSNAEERNLSGSLRDDKLKADSSFKIRLKHFSRFRSNIISPSTPTSVCKKHEVKDISRFAKLQLPTDSDENSISYSKEIIESCDSKEQLWKIYSHLKEKDIRNKEKLRKLQLVHQHQNKNSPDDLILLIQKWLAAGQSALRRLYEVIPDPKPDDMQSLIDHLLIDANLIKYNQDSDTFS